VRESLGAVLLKIGDDAGAEEAFRADLDRNPRNPRSLLRPRASPEGSGEDLRRRFRPQTVDANWKGAVRPTVDDLV